ncbi:MAG: hypothetical protein FD145_1420 [Candidatus Saganbacteria bacterium]|uniref:Uncharacterized protein n=1 Tax=Candidatus Saganbacteria bacterium TaxID=2575572 RepID=A0A833L2T3_UNCSA|nr:MAG: hypothetical protein FD145_1420 [Candidatus Saganbacteria bacterium]
MKINQIKICRARVYPLPLILIMLLFHPDFDQLVRDWRYSSLISARQHPNRNISRVRKNSVFFRDKSRLVPMISVSKILNFTCDTQKFIPCGLINGNGQAVALLFLIFYLSTRFFVFASFFC